MHVYIAGGTGAIGTRLIRRLVERGHRVTATTRDPAKTTGLERLGAHALVVDGLDSAAVRIQVIRSVINPDKLHHLGPVADACALMRETPPPPAG
jgi:nucleoside-diphosphate-sugar epimerase